MPFPLRKTLILLPLSLLLLLALVTGLVLATIGTEAGTRLLATQVRGWAGDQLAWQEIRGKLLGPLELRGVQLSQPGLEIALGSLTLDWRPAALLQGRLELTRLEIADARIEVSESGDPPPPASPFRPGDLPLPMDVWLGQIEVRHIQLIMADQSTQQITRLQLAARLENRQLSLRQFQLHTAEGDLQASGSTELHNNMPLDLQLAWDWRLPDEDSNNAASTPANTNPPLSGQLAVTGKLQWADPLSFDLQYQANGQPMTLFAPQLPEQIQLSGRVAGQFQDEALQLDQVSMAMQGLPAQLALRGKVLLPATGEPGFDGQLRWQGLQWPLQGLTPLIASPQGTLELAGSASDYQLRLATRLAGSQIPAGEWLAQGRGNQSELQLDKLQGLLLSGSLELAGTVGWDPVPRWSLTVGGHDLDPGQWQPEYPGKLALELQTHGQITADQGPQAELELQQLRGQLAGYAFELSALAALTGEAVELQSLQVGSGGNTLTARGQLSEQSLDLSWQLAAPQPSGLLDGLRGSLSAKGQLLGSAEAPRLQATLHGTDLGMDNYDLSQVQAELQAGLGATAKLQLNVTLGPLHDGEMILLQGAQLQANGTTEQHQLTLNLDAVVEQLQVRLEGGLDQTLTNWDGNLTRLDVASEDYGDWRLTGAAPLALAATAAQLGEVCLQAASEAGQVCASGAWDQTGSGSLVARLQALPVEQLLPNMGGELDGKLSATVAADGALQAKADLAISPGPVRLELEQGTQELSHGGGELALTIDDGGLDARLEFLAPAQGRILARVQLPGLNHIPLAEKQPLTGRIQAQLPDLSALPALIPDLAASAGRLNADLRLAGSLDQPLVVGEIALADGAADIPLAGLELRQIELRAASEPERPGQMSLSGGLVSGAGRLDLAGQVDIASNTVALNVIGDRVQIYNTPDARAVASPDLQISWSDEILKLRGQVVIPEAAITPKLGLTAALQTDTPEATPAVGQIVAPSPDVVVIDAGGEVVEPAVTISPIKLDNQITLILGEDVNVNALGLISRISGTVTFTNKPDSNELLPLADGSFSIEDGTFRAFGQDLDIETGQLIFGGVPVDQPELNVRAVRWIDNDPNVTVAGVSITGAANEPTLELFSRRQLEASEIQSYLLTGRGSGDNENVLSIGTYVHPKFYVGYGYNLIEKTNEFNTLYTITPRYGVGANFGEADSNVNLTFTHEH